MHLHSCNPTFHNRTSQKIALANMLRALPFNSTLDKNQSFQAHYFALCCIRMLQEIGEYWFAWHIHQLSVDHECQNVWITVLQCITCPYFQRRQFGKYVGNTTIIPIKMSQTINPAFSNCNQLSAMRGKDGGSDTWLQRSAHLTQFCIQLSPLKKGKEDFIFIFQHEQINVI